MDASATYAELRRIKQFRERNAGSAVRRSQSVVDQSAKEVQRRRKAKIDFQTERLLKERQLFEDIRNQQVKVRELEDMNRRVAMLREREARMETEIIEAEQQLEKDKKALADAKARHAAAVREVEKFDQLIAIQKASEARERMMRDENEVEEIVAAGYGRS